MALDTDETTWIRRLPATVPGGLRLICFPHAGGSASYFVALSAALSPALEVLAVQYPGRQDRCAERPGRTIAELADPIADAIARMPAGRLAFFGHSMGAAVAFEVARGLGREGTVRPERLFASAMRPPALEAGTVAPKDDAGLLAELEAIGGTDRRLLADPDLRAMILPAFRSDYGAVESYLAAPSDTVDCPISVLLGDRDPKVAVDAARGWQKHTTGGFEMQLFPGAHFYLDHQVAAVAEVVVGRLRTAGAST